MYISVQLSDEKFFIKGSKENLNFLRTSFVRRSTRTRTVHVNVLDRNHENFTGI